MRIKVRRAAWSFVVASTLLLVSCGQADDQAATSAVNELPTSEEVSAAISDSLSAAGVPGALVLIINEKGEESLTQYGDSKIDQPVSALDQFAFRSITKSLIGTVVLQLADEEKIDLQSPISDFLEGVPNGEQITIEQLATMRSGLANYSTLPSLGELLTTDPTREPDLQALLDPAFAASPVFDAGAAYEYSNTNTLLLGELIEKVTGEKWMNAVENRILTPLKMTQTEYGFDGSSEEASGYQVDAGKIVEELPPVAPGFFGAAGALTGPIHDLAIWGEELGTGTLLDEKTQEYRLKSLGSTSDDPASPHYNHYGFAMGELSGWFGHTGNGLGFQALTMHDPNTHQTVAIMLNGTGENSDLPADLFENIRVLL